MNLIFPMLYDITYLGTLFNKYSLLVMFILVFCFTSGSVILTFWSFLLYKNLHKYMNSSFLQQRDKPDL